ncbi:flagellar hook assembly protein FlgD [Microvirga pakistanensis]|uniref:flagellar hook assembly protein FlgD n=1 Tax=Microvirga pakistanensis TaxID=1682650 RepID=UPI00106A9B46|nr:flagellar hook assembly protein FlgD [Microvirga pakistanensis]
MNVASLTASGVSQKTSTAEKTSTVSYDNFLRLLLTQMQNQDPTDPMKSTEYMAQLATFSQVEQAVKSNEKLDALLSSVALSQADSVIGRTVTSADGKVSGEVTSVKITSQGPLATLSNGSELLLGQGVVVS